MKSLKMKKDKEMKRILVFIIIIIALIVLVNVPLLAQQNSYTLEEAISTGLENSKVIQIAESKVKGSDALTEEMHSNKLPKLSLSAYYKRLSDVPDFQIQFPGSPVPITVQESILDQYGMNLNITQPIFTGFRLSAMEDAARFQAEAQKKELDLAMNNEAFAIEQAYWNYFKAIEIKTLIDENVVRMEKHLEDTKNYFDNELVTKSQLLKVQVQLSEIKLQQLQAKNGVALARTAFNKAIGVSLHEKTTIDRIEITPEKSTISYEEYKTEALQNRLELESLQYRIKAGEEHITAAHSGWIPNIYVAGNFTYSRPNQRIFPQKDRFDETWDIGVQMQWNIWDWGNTSAKTEQAEQQVLQLRTMKEDVSEKISLEVYNAYLKLQSAYDQVLLAKEVVEQAEEQSRVVKTAYDVQMATATELTDAETALLHAKTELTTSMVDYRIAVATFHKSLGRVLY